MKCEKVQKEAAKREKFVPFAPSSYVSQSYTHTLSPSPSLPCFLSLLLLSLLGRPPSPSAPPTPAPCFSLLSSALAACQRLCYGRTRHWGLKLSTDVDGDKGRWSTKPESGGGAAAVCVLEGQRTVLPEEPSTTMRCQVTLYTLQCDGEEMLLVWVLHSVNTEHLCHIFTYQNMFYLFHILR